MEDSFDQIIEQMAIYLEQVEDTLILIAVTDDTVLRDHTVKRLGERLEGKVALLGFRFDAEHLSLLEGAVTTAASATGRVAVSVTGLEALPRDKQSEAIKLLNLQRNRFGRSNVAVILWVTQAILAEIAMKAADFYSWRSSTFFIPPPPDLDTLASARRSYLQALVYHNEYVNLQGLAPMRGGRIVQMRMDEIFIPLRAEQEVRLSASHLLRLDGEKFELLSGSELMLLADQPSRRENPRKERASEYYWPQTQREVKSRPVEIAELLRERRAIVLGDPGAGKTTLLRYVAYCLAQSQIKDGPSEFITQNPHLAGHLPVYVRIGLYSQHLQQNPEATLDDYAPLGCQLFQLPMTDELLKTAMAQGRVLFLLDGLDEIIDTTQRREVAQRVEQFARAHAQCPIIVTSRIVGYREAHLSGEFSQFTIRPFEEPEIRKFAESWYQSLGMPNSADALVNAIQGNDSIRKLASNPLLLTVIALIHHRGDKLPHHRVKLYRLAAETLVDQWMSARRVTPEGWNAQETIDVLLPAIAWHLHQTTSSGLVGEQELHGLLVETLRQHHARWSENETHAQATQFRRNVNEFSGIFLERGLDQEGRGIYGFLHLTFEEYFAAVRLTDKWEREGDQVLKPLLHDPRWNEIILLAAGRLGEFSQYQATQFVRRILEAQSEYEDILHRDLLLAARCLADDVRVDAELRRTILDELLEIYFSPQSPPSLTKDISQALPRFGGTSVQPDLLATLTERLAATEWSVRDAATWALGRMGQVAATPEVLSALLTLLADSEVDVRDAAAWTLGRMGQVAATPEVLSALLTLLADSGGSVRDAAANALGWMGQAAATPEVLSALLTRLADSRWDVRVRSAAAKALGQMGQAAATPEVLSALLTLLADSRWKVWYAAAKALRGMGQAAAIPEVLSALLTLLADSRWKIRSAAAKVLGRMGQVAATPEVLSALLTLLADSGGSVRDAAAKALGQMGQAAATPEVLSALPTLLSDSRLEVRSVAAWALGQMGQAAATPEVLSALLTLLADSRWDVRAVVASALKNLSSSVIFQDQARVIKLFLHLAHEKKDMEKRNIIYIGLRNLLAATPQ